MTTHQHDLAILYEPDYEIEDICLFEPFVVLKSVQVGRPAWWSGSDSGKRKVERLFHALKIDLTVFESCIYAGISGDQYREFARVHADAFPTAKVRLKTALPISAKEGLVKDIKNPEGFKTRQWYLERKQPKLYGRPGDAPAITPPPGGAVLTTSRQVFKDKDGKVVMSRQLAEQIKHGGDSNTTGQ